jgi:hypothetical protein
MRYNASMMDDEQLWEAFAASALPASAWTHEAHVRIAFMFVQRFALDEAHLLLRAGIIRLNPQHGLVESSTRGYFETLTRAWLILVLDAHRRALAPTSFELLARCPELRDRHLALRHYSEELLATVRARAMFVAPDLVPLPEPP